MSYATPGQVKSLFRDFADNDDAAVNDGELQEFLDDAEAIINAKLATIYTLPVTEVLYPEAFTILKRLSTFKVACIVDDILNNYSEADKKPMWCKKAEELMNAIVPPLDPKTCKQCPPSLLLPGVPYTGVNTQRGRIKISATTGTVFKKNQDNW